VLAPMLLLSGMVISVGNAGVSESLVQRG